MPRAVISLSRIGIGRGLKIVLILQALVAGFVLLSDIDRWGRIGAPGDAAPSGPIAPGDQTRRYDPDRVTPRFAPPGTRPGIDLPPDLPRRLEFSVIDDTTAGRVLMVIGAIAEGDARRFDAFLSDLPEPPERLAINSPGGIVMEALDIGRMVRDRALGVTMLPGTACLSACPYILAGGTERQVSATAAVGLHQHSYETPGYIPVFLAVEDIQRSQGETMAYLIEMGIDPGVMVHGLTTPPQDIYILLESELIDSRLATEIIE